MTEQIHRVNPPNPGDQRQQRREERQKKREEKMKEAERKRFLSFKRRDVFVSESLDSDQPAVYSSNPALRQKLLEQRHRHVQNDQEVKRN